MSHQQPDLAVPDAHRAALNLGVVAVIFTVLFLSGLVPVTALNGRPFFPSPKAPADRMITYFQTRPSPVLIGAFLHFGAAMALGVFTTAVVGRLRLLGVRGAGADIALFGGLMAAFNMAGAALVQWVLAQPGIAQEAAVVRPLYFVLFAHGGPGYSVPLGLLIGGVSVPAGSMRLLPRWVVGLGILLAVVGELSCFSLIALGRLTILIPLTRFPGFVWMIAAGFLLPKAGPFDSPRREANRGAP